MKKTRKMLVVLLTVTMVATLFSGCKKKELIVDESKDSSTQVSVELPTVTKEPVNTKAPEEGKEVAAATEAPTPEATEEATTTPEVTEMPEVTEAPTEEPTVKPTEAPKVTSKPTATPKPTAAPTPVPTAVPTAVPTQAPTQAPEVPKPTIDPNFGVGPTDAPPAPTAVPQPDHTHSYDGGVVTTEANCGKDGVRTYTCSCGATKTEAIPATGNHGPIDEEWNAYPTCTSGGSHNDKCTVCGTYLGTIRVDMLPHDFESTPGYAGDCSRPATFSQKCKVCGAPGETLYGEKDPNNHDWETVYGEEWDDALQKWVAISETYCGRCGDSKGVVRVE